MAQNTGNMAELRDLIAKVGEGCRVKVVNHDYCNANGEQIVTRTFVASPQTYRHEGKTHTIREGGPAYMSKRAGSGQENRYQFPVAGDDFTVEGNTLRVYRPADPRIGKRRVIALTLTYFPVES